METSERHIIRELVIHGVAYCVAAGLGAIIFARHYWLFEQYTGNPSEAQDAFLTCAVVAGSIGPATTLLLFWAYKLIRPSRGG